MRFNPAPLLRLLSSRAFAITLILASLAMTLACFAPWTDLDAARGLGLPSPDGWIASPTLSLAAALLTELAVVAGIMLANKAFNLLRGFRNGSLLWSGLFMLFQGASPASAHFGGGYLLLVCVMSSIAILYTCYQQPGATRSVFSVFLLIGAGAMVADGFIPYILVMALGCMQMRVMTPRGAVAMLAGLAVPPWLLWAFGLWTPSYNPPDISLFLQPEMLRRLIYPAIMMGMTLLLGLFTGLLDMVNIYARNAMTRARFGIMAATGIMTGLMCVADFSNIDLYTPLLNATTAYLITLLFSLRQRAAFGPGAAALLFASLSYLILYIWRLTSSLV
ncbi:MAG: hypothetical protein NC342_05585 [Pseudoflavonifractor sp.]|nr:hypothetical protein [Alloprevotella sp.]MCM1116988.1 hypothetical protein [Pseudoflavonifractor sp.]